MENKTLFGLPVWMALVALGGAGLVAYLAFFRNQGPATAQGGTTGYSAQGLAVMQNPDESATMALQNQELSQIAKDMGTQFTALGSQVTGVSNTLGGQLSGIANTQQQQGAAAQSYYNSLLNSMMTYASQLSTQMTAEQTALANGQATIIRQQLQGDAHNQINFNAVQGGLNSLQGLLNDVQSKQVQTFYAIPNRQTTYLQ